MVFNHIPNFGALSQAVPEKQMRGYICMCAHAHMQIYPTYELCEMNHYLVFNHPSNMVIVIPELQLSDPF